MNNTEQVFIPSGGASIHVQQRRPPRLSPPKPLPTVNLQNVEDFSKVCRVCALVSETVMPIFSEEGLQNKIADLINKFLPIQVVSGDQLPMPMAVCYPCANTLLAAQALARRCVQADAALRTRSSQLASKRLEAQKKERFEKVLKKHGVQRCRFCNAALAAGRVREHMRAHRLVLLIDCQQCARRIFIPHMYAHAARLARLERLERLERDPPPVVTASIVLDEFSDDSDAEDRFGPLPDSVLRAIEDSQDAHPVETSQAPPASSQTPPEPPAAPETTAQNPPQTQQASPKVAKNVPQVPQGPKETPKNPPVALKELKVVLEKKPIRSCPHCNRTFTASSSFFYHIKHFHNQSKEHECSVCGSRFGTRGALREHASVHTGERERQCTNCPKKFRSKASLYIHQQTHGALKKFACSKCGSAFRWSTQLSRHMARHAAERKHACGTCGNTFKVRADMLRHQRTHARAAYACPMPPCAARFAQARYLRAHIAKKHSKAPRGAKGKS